MRRKRSEGAGSGSVRQRAPDPGVPGWNPATRIGFRFAFAYLGLFALATQVAGSLFVVPGVSFRGLGALWPMREITFQVAARVFGAGPGLDPTGSNGETIFFWSQTVWLFVVAVAAAGVWTVFDRARPDYHRAHAWFRLLVRLGLAAQMFEYGMTKIIPNQFEAPALNILVTPAGDLSLNTHFWTSVGASPGYQMFTGWAELLGGVLLLVPRTTLLGALICLADMIHVFVLNMTFDIGLKLTTLHLILMTLFLLAPDLKRLADFFVLGRTAEPYADRRLFSGRRRNRVALAVPVLVGVYLIGMQTWANVGYWYAEGGGAPRSVLYGIWNVERLAVDGQSGPPSLNEYDRRWRRVIFDSPDAVSFERTDDSFARYGARIDTALRTVTLSKSGSATWDAVFDYERPSETRLILDGRMDGRRIQLELERVEFDTFRLLNSHFRWIRPEGG